MNNNLDTSITHITSKDGDNFEGLSFKPRQAAKVKIKIQLMRQITERIKETQFKQEQIAYLLHVTGPRISDVTRGKVGKFSIDALVDMLERMGKHVTVQVN